MFRRLHDAPRRRLAITVDGREVEAFEGDSVAAVLLAIGVSPTRVSAVSGAPRAPYCMMGVCFECLVTVDGVGNRQGCMVPVRAGMAIETQKARREAQR
jgi:sarcosine oxidase subunit alpha